MALKFGIAVPHSGPLAHVDNISRVAVLAEKLGFDSLLAHDHISYDTEWLGHRVSGLVDVGANVEPDFFEALTTLSFVAGITSRLRLSTNILVLPLREPRVLARQLITLQALSKGRLVLGVGIGDYRAEFSVMQIPYAEKTRIAEESLAVLSAVLPGGRSSYRGEHVEFDNGSFFPRVQPIPVLLGGGIRRSPDTGILELYEPVLERIAKWGHGWIPEGPAALVAEGRQRLSELARSHGRENVAYEIRVNSPLYLAEDETARRKTKRDGSNELIGSVSTVIERIQAFQCAGADAMNLRCWAENVDSLCEMLEQFATDVMPQFA